MNKEVKEPVSTSSPLKPMLCLMLMWKPLILHEIESWFDNAVMCFNWFLGQNDFNLPLYDPITGGCMDGLMADGINQNEGAESSLAWLLSLMTLQKLYADEILYRNSSH